MHDLDRTRLEGDFENDDEELDDTFEAGDELPAAAPWLAIPCAGPRTASQSLEPGRSPWLLARPSPWQLRHRSCGSFFLS